jgi:signal transduction histidine kinase
VPARRSVRAAIASVGLLSCSALLAHFSGGYIEAHFHFFIVVVLLGLYEDWLPFVLAFGYVFLHHGIVGTISPSSIYNHPAAQAHPWRWAAIHGAAISLAGIFSIWTWKLNAELRAQRVNAARVRLAAQADETRRQIERDLHDGAQQQLVSLALALRSAEAAVPSDQWELRQQVSQAAEDLTGVVDELREISRGIHPGILSHGGLVPALRVLARRSTVPVELDVRCPKRLSQGVEVAAYYVVSEALTNVAKHANATSVHIDVDAGDSAVQLAIHDDGVGGADPARGSGLIGLTDRVEALEGTISVVSPIGAGTTVQVNLPVSGS